MKVIQPGMYKHFKGGEYEVVGIAKHSEALEELVLYKHNGDFWVPPKNMFFEEVDRPGHNHKGPRFTFLRPF